MKSKWKKPQPTEWTKRRVWEAQNGYCIIDGCYNKIDDLHHVVPNTRSNNEKWPLFLQSPFNLPGICRKHHDSEVIYQFHITDKQAEMYEDYLILVQQGKETDG